MAGMVSKSIFAAAALALGVFAAPLTASAGGYGYSYENTGGYQECWHDCGYSYQPVCHWEKVTYYDRYYDEYRVKKVRVCDSPRRHHHRHHSFYQSY